MKRLLATVAAWWRYEPVLVRAGLSTAVAAGVLTATQASAIGDGIAAVVAAVGLIAARQAVRPAPKAKPPVKS